MNQSKKKEKHIVFLQGGKKLLCICLLLLSTFTLMAQKTVNGQVKDVQGEPVIGASISVKGTAEGTITDLNGNFSLDVSESAILVISYIGYKTQEITPGGRSTVTVVLEEDMEALDEVIVVGYGVQRKSDLTGSVTSLKAEDIRGLASGNAAEALQAKAPGVIVNNDGSPGAAPTVRIRGIGTSGNAAPLYVVDGMMVDGIQYLNSGDIASMEVLKDASATAIYGSRGANGVILVTTKQGKAGKPVINYTGSEGFQFFTTSYDIANASEYAQLVNIMSATNGGEQIYSNPSQYGKGTDWLDEVSRKGWMRDHQLSVAGGSEDITYNFSFGYLSQKGLYDRTEYERLTFRLNNQYKVTKTITVGHNLALTNQSFPFGLDYRFQRSVYGFSPLLTPLDENGEYTRPQDNEFINPYAMLELNRNHNNRNLRFVGNVWGTWEIIPGLTLRTSYGIDWDDSFTKQFTEAYDINPSFQSSSLNSYYEDTSRRNTWLWENTLTWDKQLGDHRFTLLGGVTAQKYTYRGLYAESKGFVVDNPDYATLLTGSADGYPSISSDNAYLPVTEKKASYLFRVNYAFKDRYLLTASLRADGSSKFIKGTPWGYFPSAALGWRVSEEAFMEDAEWLSNLKIRGSWGQTGNDKIDTNYAAYYMVSQEGEFHAIFDGTRYGSAIIRSAANPDIKWERNEQLDLGFEFGVLNNRLSFEFDYYTRDTKDLLMILPMKGGTAGIGNTYSNAGAFRNRGVEFAVNWEDFSREFKYQVRFTGSTVKNKVIDTKRQTTYSSVWSTNSYQGFEEGLPYLYYYGFNTIGIYQTQADLDRWNAYAQSHGHDGYHSDAQLGDLIFEDVDGDGRITDADKTNLGNPYPKFIGGLSFNASYKGFDFSMDIASAFGFKVMNTFYNTVSSTTSNLHKDWLDAWTPQNTNTDMPRLGTGSININNTTGFNVFNGDYVKIRHIELGYTFPYAMMSAARIQNLRIYLNASNPLYFTKYKGLSPEVSGGIDYNSYPLSGSLRLGVNLTF